MKNRTVQLAAPKYLKAITLFALVAPLPLAVSCSSGGNNTVDLSVTGVILSKSTVNLSMGDTETIVTNVIPRNASNKAVEWISNDTGVATVNNNGTVTAVNNGTTTITAISQGDVSKFATCTVIVAPPVPVTYSGLAHEYTGFGIGQQEIHCIHANQPIIASAQIISRTIEFIRPAMTPPIPLYVNDSYLTIVGKKTIQLHLQAPHTAACYSITTTEILVTLTNGATDTIFAESHAHGG
jgi:hypothetical protein